MIECTSCHTLNPDSESACLMCSLPLPAALHSGPAPLRCPAGHPIDPSWRSCPYCDRLQAVGRPDSAGRSTRLEATAAGSPFPAAPPAFAPTAVQSPGPAGSRATRLEATPQAPRRTVLAEAPPPPSEPTAIKAPIGPSGSVQQVASRPLVGVLAAPGFGPGGSVFAVRQGKNVIGSDRASDVCLSADPRVSLEHALLLHRGSGFYLADRMSTNGTWVNDEEVPANGTVVLRDRDRIRCGEAELIFFIIERAEGIVDASAD